MFYIWRRDESDSDCGVEHTVTVTETVLQDAATSTVVQLIAATSTAFPTDTFSTGLPNVGLNAAPGSDSSNAVIDSQQTSSPSDAAIINSSSSSSSQEITVSVTSTLGTTKTLNLVAATPSTSASRTTSTGATPHASECSSKSASHSSSSAPAATIAGSVVGSMAGLALIGLLVTYLLKRKRKRKRKREWKLNIKKKTTTAKTEEKGCQTTGEQEEEGDAVQIGNMLSSLDALERRRSFASPRSFEFGFNPATASAVSPSLPPLPFQNRAAAASPPEWI